MSKRSENKDRVLLWISEHKEALKSESLKLLKEAFPDERKQNLSAWKKEYILKGSNSLKQVKTDSIVLKQVESNNQKADRSAEPKQQTGSKSLKQVTTDKTGILTGSIGQQEPAEINENCYYTVEQAADRLQVDSTIIYRLIKNKALQVLNVGATGCRPTFRILGKWILEIKSE